MKLTQSEEQVEKARQAASPEPASTWRERFRALLTSWELYPILFVAGLLRLYHIDTSVFTEDEAVLFRMAHDAVAHGLLPVTANKASIGPLNPPLFTYMMMLPAAISASPLGGEILVGLLNTGAVLLTYLFTRRYYGRLTGASAALLYATSVGALIFSRDIWQPNLIPFFVLLFWFALFRGVVERRKGWLFPALLLMGVLYQLHGSTLLLGVPLCLALLFAWRTVRVRDVVFAAAGLVLIFVPFLILELHTGFSELRGLLQAAKNPAHTDLQALHFYKLFLGSTLKNPYLDNATRLLDTHIILANGQSILAITPLYYFKGLLEGETAAMPLLALCAGLIVAGIALFPRHKVEASDESSTRQRGGLVRWWADLYAAPYRQGLILLLAWQVAPLVLLLRHSITLYSHYFIFLLPGQFILLAIAGGKVIELVGRVGRVGWVGRYQPGLSQVVRVGMGGLAVLILMTQLIGSASYVVDMAHGNFDGTQAYPYITDLSSFQHALKEADQLAQQRHLTRIYAPTAYAYSTTRAFPYLGEELKTPITFVDTWHCFVLPDPGAGPVVFLAQPGSPLSDAFLSQYATATLIDQPRLLGGAPFKLYILTSKAESEAARADRVARSGFQESLQLLAPGARLLQSSSTNQQWLTTRWRVMNTLKAEPRTTYNFMFRMQNSYAQHTPNALQTNNITCSPTATWAGDQLFAFQEYVKGVALPTRITTQVATFTERPATFAFGPLTMTTFNNVETGWKKLRTVDSKGSVELATAS